eukprot:TRINITY_DN9191_c1_g1_i3.p2 TRINITY_DN9191_c1_g1~~TRINITY_DN9191_c1_g1_i3.p2  ORF type:complete len:212 (-),score=-4.41 TRINITY_DN9191_c1_g1_i3:742-1377(-)
MIDLDTKLGITLAIVQPIKHAIKKFWKMGRNVLKLGKFEIGPTLVKLLCLCQNQFWWHFWAFIIVLRMQQQTLGMTYFFAKNAPLLMTMSYTILILLAVKNAMQMALYFIQKVQQSKYVRGCGRQQSNLPIYLGITKPQSKQILTIDINLITYIEIQFFHINIKYNYINQYKPFQKFTIIINMHILTWLLLRLFIIRLPYCFAIRIKKMVM